MNLYDKVRGGNGRLVPPPGARQRRIAAGPCNPQLKNFCGPFSPGRGNTELPCELLYTRNQGVSNYAGPDAVGGPERYERPCAPPRYLTSFRKRCRNLVETRLRFPSHVCRVRGGCGPDYRLKHSSADSVTRQAKRLYP